PAGSRRDPLASRTGSVGCAEPPPPKAVSASVTISTIATSVSSANRRARRAARAWRRRSAAGGRRGGGGGGRPPSGAAALGPGVAGIRGTVAQVGASFNAEGDGGRRFYHQAHAPRDRQGPDPPLDPAGGPAAARAAALGRGGRRPSRRLPLPRRLAD